MNNDELRIQIEKYIEAGYIEEANQLILQYKELIGNNDEIASMEAVLKIYMGEYDKGLECIREGLKFNINNSDLYFTMGNIYEIKKEYDRAYLCYEKSLLYNLKEENKNVILSAIENLKSNYEIKVNNYSIVILTYNQLDYTKVCINSIKNYNGNDDCEIIIIDNNSTDGTVEWIKEQEGIKYILNEENKGFPAGCNQGIEIANKDNDIFLLNNDTVIMPNSIFNLRMGLYSSEKVGATGAVSNSVSYYQQISEQYDDFETYMNYSLRNNISDEAFYEERVKLVGFAMLIKRETLNKVGLLDERFTPGNFEDDDISFRIIKEGYKLLLCKDSYIHHFGSVSFKEDSKKYTKLLETNSRKFKEKWGFVSEYSNFIRNEIVDQIDELKNKNINVLEIGCATGATLLEIKNRYKSANIYGIEINKKAAEIAESFADIRSDNVESIELSYEEKFFDYIIFADVLEHLQDPWSVLNNIKKYLKDDGYILASIPNVMHYSVVRELLNGNWSYADSGILDRTHLRFFTLSEINKMLINTGYSMEKCLSTSLQVDNNDKIFIDELVKLSSDSLTKQFEAYQYIVKAKKFFDKKVRLEDKHQTQKANNLSISNKSSENIYESNATDKVNDNICESSIINKNCDIRGIDRIFFGKGVVVQKDCWLNVVDNDFKSDYMIEFGDGTNIGRRSTISASNKIVLGKNVLLGPNVFISDHNHEYRHIEIPIIYQGITSYENFITIGDNTWIGTNSCIVGNVKIGKNCVVAANSVVKYDVPDYCVVAGSPAKVVKFFDIETGKWCPFEGNEKALSSIEERKELLKYTVPITKLKSMQIEVSSICNLECPQCFNKIDGHVNRIFSRELWDEKIKPYLNQLEHIHLVGIGEPLLCKDLFYFIEDSKQSNLIVHTTSNLQLVDENIAKQIVLSGLDELSFSCDGIKDETYGKIRINGKLNNLKKALELINKFKKEFNSITPRLILNFGALKMNISELPKLVEFAANNNVDEVIAYHDIIYNENLKEESLYNYKQLSDEMFIKAYEKAKALGIKLFIPGLFSNPIKYCESGIYCGYPFSHLWIYSDGRVGPCCMDFPNRFVLGDLNENSIEEIWNSKPILDLRKQLSTDPEYTCKFCVQHGKMNISDKRYFFRFKDSDNYMKKLDD